MFRRLKDYEWLEKREQLIKLVRYAFIGILTTLISFISFWLLLQRASLEANLANGISVLIAVTFAFIANKIYVFRSISPNLRHLCGELLRFIMSRAGTLLVEIAGLFLLHNGLQINAILAKAMVSVVVLSLNYMAFQFLVFKK